jgi:hypothetical protein
MHSTFGKRTLGWAGLLALVGVLLAPSPAGAVPEPGAKGRGFRLFARSLGAITVNRTYCGLNSAGEVCVDSLGSSTIGGGYWPKGTADQYIFNSGLQLAGIISGGPWDGDTTGAFFFDPKGTTVHGAEVQPIYNSQNAADIAGCTPLTPPGDPGCAWPAAAAVPSTGPASDFFDNLLKGRTAASQGDIWYVTWEGDPGQNAGRPHPLGILAEVRGIGWNYPRGNEDILYFIYTFYNVTSLNGADYASARPEMQSLLLAQAQEFHARNNAAFGVTLPTGGYTISNLYAAFARDDDVADAGANFSSVNLPFALGYTYEQSFYGPGQTEVLGWTFDAEIFAPPFFPGPGFTAAKYLAGPDGPGEIQLFSNTINSATGFRDAQNTTQLFRYLSGNISEASGDAACTYNPVTDRICYIRNTGPFDMRFFQSSTALDLAPGEAGTIVVAYIHAAPVAVPGFTPTSATAVFPGDPRILVEPATLGVTGANLIDSLMGFLDYNDDNTNGIVEQNEFVVVPGSTLGKSLLAQQIFDAKFLLPFSPDAPEFYLVPGDNQVTVLWQPSASETTGDPYVALTREPLNLDLSVNTLYDPNYRELDVEGYRIYRGRVDNPTELDLVAQFDHAGTTMLDFYGFINPNSLCAPELGILDNCPVAFDDPTIPGNELTVSTEYSLTGPIIQSTGRVPLADGTALVVGADTLLTGEAAGFPELSDTGVPFAFIDRDVRNGFRYFYTVTTFDVNSIKSAPSSLESARTTRAVVPRKDGTTQQTAQLSSGLFGADGTELDPSVPWGIDDQTGRFRGTPPPTNGLAASFAPLVPALLPALNLTARIDSMLAYAGNVFPCGAVENGLGSCYEAFVTFNRDGTETQFRTLLHFPVWSSFDGLSSTVTGLGALPIAADPDALERHDVPAGFAQFNATVNATAAEYIRFSAFEGQSNRRNLPGAGAGFGPGGSRWFEGADETVDHPTASIRVGSLPGVDTIWAPIHHTDIDPLTAGLQQYANSGSQQCFGYGFAGFGRQADVQLTWGPGGTVASVVDITHHSPVMFKPTVQASYGFVTDANEDGVIGWVDFEYSDQMVSHMNDYLGFCTAPGVVDDELVDQPVIGPVSTDQAISPAAATGTGFGLYINGERYIFQLTGGTPPAEGTVWTLRTHAGTVRASAGGDGPTPSGYSFVPVTRPPFIPGVEVRFTVNQATTFAAASPASLSRVHTVPDPYYVTNQFEQTTETKIIKFVNLPPQAIIRIYSASGVLVRVIEHDDTSGGGEASWDVRNRNNQVVASGVYFFHIESGEARKVGRFTVVNFAQ